MVTAAIAANRRCTVRSVVTQCFLFCLTVSCTIAVLLLCFSDFAAAHILGNAGAAPSLRILALGLPFMSQCTCMKGYFLAVDESLSTSWSDAVEQVLTIFSAVVLFWYFAPQSIEAACFAAMIASTFGEAVSFLAGFLIYRRSLKRNTPKEKEQATGVLHGMFHMHAFERGAQLAFNGGKSAHPARARALRAQSCGFHVRLRFIAGHGNADAVLSVFVFDVVRVFAHPENGAGI